MSKVRRVYVEKKKTLTQYAPKSYMQRLRVILESAQ